MTGPGRRPENQERAATVEQLPARTAVVVIASSRAAAGVYP